MRERVHKYSCGDELGQLGDIEAKSIGIYIELLKERRINPGDEVFKNIAGTSKVEFDKRAEDNGIPGGRG
jgi:hypothetical protein